MIGDMGTAFPQPLCQLLLREPKLLHQHLIGGCLFNRRQILTLKVFQYGQFHHLLLIKLPYNNGDRLEISRFRCTIATLTDHDFIAFDGFPDDDRLKDPMLLDGGLQLFDRLGLEDLTGLIRIRTEILQLHFLNRFLFFICCE